MPRTPPRPFVARIDPAQDTPEIRAQIRARLAQWWGRVIARAEARELLEMAEAVPVIPAAQQEGRDSA